MSTRCHLKVIESGMSADFEPILLYHHCDGYPSNMIPVIQRAWQIAIDEANRHIWDGKPKATHPNWEAGRGYKVAGFLCAADPGQMEPLPYQQYHGDIEYFYLIHVENSQQGSLAEKPLWKVEILCPKSGFWDAADDAHLERKVAPTDIRKMDGEAIEKAITHAD